MTPLLGAALLWLVHKNEGFGSPASSRSTRRSRGRRHHSSATKTPTMAPMQPSPADHAASEHVVHHAPHHASPAEHAAHEVPESSAHDLPQKATHDSPAPADAPTVIKARVVHHKKRKRVTRLPVQHITASPSASEPVIPVAPVSRVQAILRGLGWTGDLTTKGSVHPELTDGLFGPITVRDWQQSANKRGLDPTIERVNGTTVHVNADTYAALTAVAKSKGAVVGIYIP